MDIERALKNIGDWISKETESRKYPKSELLELSESLQALKASIARQTVTDEAVQDAISWLESDKIDRQREWEKQDTEWKLEPGAKEMHDSSMSAFDLAIQALRQMKPSEWIPVSERLPEEKDASANNKILVLFDNGFVDIWNYLLFVYHVTSNAEFDLAQITHWMPLPQPPESEARV